MGKNNKLLKNKRLRAEIPPPEVVLEIKLQIKGVKPSDRLRDVLDNSTFDCFKEELNKKGKE